MRSQTLATMDEATFHRMQSAQMAQQPPQPQQVNSITWCPVKMWYIYCQLIITDISHINSILNSKDSSRSEIHSIREFPLQKIFCWHEIQTLIFVLRSSGIVPLKSDCVHRKLLQVFEKLHYIFKHWRIYQLLPQVVGLPIFILVSYKLMNCGHINGSINYHNKCPKSIIIDMCPRMLLFFIYY